MSKIGDFLKGAGTFYLATVDGDQPKIRPLGMFMDGDDYVRFGIGTFKDCWKQMMANPKVEIVACQGAKWLRYTGKVVVDDACWAEKALEENPNLKNIYNEETGNVMGVFHLEDATAYVINLMPALGCEDLLA